MLRRTIVAVILTVSTVVAGVLLANQPVPTEARQERFEPAFTETFDGPRLDRDVWATCYWWNRRGCTNESTGERQWYTRGSVTVSDDKLVLTARRRSVAASDGRRYPYTSGMVTTGQRRDTARARPGFAFKYGRVSARVRVPAGRGLWAALWMLPTTLRSRPEIDIFEVLGHQPDRVYFHTHYWKDGKRRDPGAELVGVDASAGWHRYDLVWRPRKLVWMVDRKVAWTLEKPAAIPHQPMYLLINLAVGGEWPGSPDASTSFPARLEVDWVRIRTRSRP